MSTVYVSHPGRHSTCQELFPFDLYEIVTRRERAVMWNGQNTSRKLQVLDSVSSMLDIVLLQ